MFPPKIVLHLLPDQTGTSESDRREREGWVDVRWEAVVEVGEG